MTDGDWRLLPVMVLRSAGFPWQLVEGLAYARSGRLLDELMELQDAATAHAAALRPARNLARGQKSKLRNFRTIGSDDEAFPPRWRSEWNRLTGRMEEVRASLAESARADKADVDAALDALRRDPRFTDAVVCSSPAVLKDLARGAKGSRIRRQLASYAQRLASKSETMSFFGPINYAVLDRESAEPSTLDWKGHAEIRDRQAHTAARVNDAVQALLLADDEIAAALVPRRKTVLRPAKPGELAGVVDGVADVRALAARLGRDLPEVLGEFRTAVARGRLTHDLAPPSTTIDPLRWTVERVDGPVRALLERTLALLEEYPDAPPERKAAIQGEIEASLPAASLQEQGTKFYNDRVIVHEAAVGTAELRVSGAFADDLAEGVAPVIDLLAHEAEQTRRLTNRAVAARLGVGRFPLVKALRECADVEIVPSTWLADTLRFDATLPEVDLSRLNSTGLVPPAGPSAPVLCSIDMLAATPDISNYQAGSTPLILGDIHDAALLTPWALQFHEDSAAILAMRDDEVRAALGDQLAVNVISRRTTGLPPLEFPGVVLELGGAASPGRDRVGLDQLWVHSDGETAELRSDLHPGQVLLFHNGELDSGLHTALALPRIRRPRLPELPHSPRLTWKNIVLSRRRWTVRSEEVLAATAKQDEVDRLLDVARFTHATGLPRRMFAKSPNERKPIYVDFTSPDLLKALTRLAGTAEELTLSEILPAADDAWLRDGELRFPSELRCVYTRGRR